MPKRWVRACREGDVNQWDGGGPCLVRPAVGAAPRREAWIGLRHTCRLPRTSWQEAARGGGNLAAGGLQDAGCRDLLGHDGGHEDAAVELDRFEQVRDELE